MPLGAHMSTAGGVEQAIVRGQSIGCEAIQLFVSNPNRWRTAPLADEDVERWHATRAALGIGPIVAHDIYLINLGSPDPELWNKSVQAMEDELRRCARLAIPCLVIHPGAHMGAGVEAGLQRVADALNRIRERTAELSVRLLLETTAGQGTVLGSTFEQLAQMIALAEDDSWLGVCLDTCHVYAAGYEMNTPEGYAEMWRQFEAALSWERLALVHLNDSKGGLGRHLDRHEHIGKGQLGLEGFRLLLNDPRLRQLPMVLETDKGPDMKEDIENLAVLRSLIKSETWEATNES